MAAEANLPEIPSTNVPASLRPAGSKLPGYRKAAIFLISLGAERAAGILKRLNETQVESLTLEVAKLKHVPHETVQDVLAEFAGLHLGMQYIARGGIDSARQLLEAGFGAERASTIIERLTTSLQIIPFSELRRLNASQLLEFLRAEHPQTIALILANMPAQTAAFILSELPAELQIDVAYRIATLETPEPEIMREVERLLTERLSPLATDLLERTVTDGLNTLVQILNNSPRNVEKNVITSFDERNSEVADKLRQALFLFEDISRLDDRSIQRILREVDSKGLAVALKGTSPELRDKIFKNMSQRASQTMQEDMEFMGPVRLREVEQAQRQIVSVTRRLEEAGEIVIAREGQEEMVV